MEENTFDNVFISLGSNLGDRFKNITTSIKKILGEKIEILKISSIYETEPVETLENFDFFNCVISLKTTYEPEKLLKIFIKIEKEMGRVRKHKNSPREIDIDILFYGNKIINKPDLIIPHPKIEERKFVLIPLNEINPEFIHPISNLKIKEILKRCTDKHKVKKIISFNSLNFFD